MSFHAISPRTMGGDIKIYLQKIHFTIHNTMQILSSTTTGILRAGINTSVQSIRMVGKLLDGMYSSFVAIATVCVITYSTTKYAAVAKSNIYTTHLNMQGEVLYFSLQNAVPEVVLQAINM